ncbi:dTDP-4-dehydrorhamnose reductase [Sinobacterium caligoides]|uniref:dTDP-4-dehydrorhamnose reductase n=1 Tax=Sinobacterium caligoides TaxID=933926 RepID=A0A3N2D508_9GAMM|nr:sugar nucleotide-binding protein [Sinobacterium caligoides]ROR94843.1 dTDP-4-dehydrorhamnose reductase [Sinobacterium caligoides]
MKVLILDDNSRVGMELVPLLVSKHYRVELLGREQLLADDEALVAINHHSVDVVVNCFNLQSPEEGGLQEHDIELVTRIAELCQRERLPCIQLSSAQVFSVNLAQGYIEGDAPNPVTRDGEMLVRAEQAMLRLCDISLVMRVGWVFSDSGAGVFEDMLMHLETGRELVVYSGLEGCPTPASDVARVVVACAEQLQAGAECYGIYHYCSSDVTSSEDFTEAIIATCQQYGQVDPEKVNIKSVDNFQKYGAVPHPALKCLRILNHFGIKQRPWRSVMASLLKDRYSATTE